MESLSMKKLAPRAVSSAARLRSWIASPGLRRHQGDDADIGGHGQTQGGRQAMGPEKDIHGGADRSHQQQCAAVGKPGHIKPEQRNVADMGQQKADQAGNEQTGWQLSVQHQEDIA
jgi:hypothetical protein